MKIDKTKLKKSLSEVPSDCKQLIEHLKSCNEDELVESLGNLKSWNYGKCELYHWIDVLDYFDSIMERCVHKDKEGQWTLPCDLPENEKDKNLLINIIVFTSLLIEHSFSKHVYSSMEHLTTLLASSDMQIVLAILNLLYVFSKRSNFISRLNPEKKLSLLSRLNHLADSWGGKENGFGLAECCQDLERSFYPPSATTLHFEFYNDETATQSIKDLHQTLLSSASTNKSTSKASSASILNTIHIDNVDQITDRTLAELMEELIATYNVPKEKQMLLFTHLRLAHYFSNYRKRLQCVQARLQALSIIVYSNAMTMQENFNVLYNGFIEELVEVLELKDNKLLEIKAAAIRTLTSIIHLDHTTKLNSIIDITGASSYHGFLPSLVRSCIQALIDNNTQQYTLQFATALFSFLYHLANYESGGEALVSCGMIDSLLKVISWKGTDSDHITFVTRAVRVIDLITNLEMAAFHTHADLNVFIDRLEYDVDMCRKDQPFEIEIKSKRRDSQDLILSDLDEQHTSMEVDTEINESAATSSSSNTNRLPTEEQILADQKQIQYLQKQQQLASNNKELQCYPQRAAVLKSILNFLKKAIQDAAFSDSIRHLMDGSLPKSLKHIISNAEYYGPSLFMLATDVVTVYVFQEPSLLSSLQENGLTDVILHALLTKDIPATKEVLASLPNVFSALCLNSRGLESFKSFKPFDKIFKVLLSPEYLPAMRRRRSTDPMGDTSINLGVSMDELMRHLPSLKQSAIAAIINLLKELCKLGSDPDTICSSKLPFKTSNALQPSDPTNQTRQSASSRPANVVQADANSSGDDEEEEEDTNPANNAVVGTVSGQANADIVGGTSSSNVDNLTNQNSNSNNTTNNQLEQSNHQATILVNSGINSNLINNSGNSNNSKQQVVPLVDYILHVMKFLDAILSNNNTEDHCREFVAQNGLEPLLMIHQLPNLPIDFPLSQACFSLGNVCKSVLSLSQEKEVLNQGLTCLQKVLDKLKPLHIPLEQPGGSVLLEELVKASELCQNLNGCDPLQSAALTPLLHNLSAAHAYIAMFIILSRSSHNEVRNICITHWGSELGQNVLKELGQLYTSLVWESTILLAFCSETSAGYSKFGQAQLERLAALSKDINNANITTTVTAATSSSTSEENTSAELRKASSDNNQQQTSQSTIPATTSSDPQQQQQMDIDESTQFNVEEAVEKTKTQVEVAQAILSNYRSKIKSNKLSPETKQIKALLTSASRLGRALAELFNHLVKLSVNSPLRHRRNHSGISSAQIMNPSVTGVANSLTKLICNALSWVPPISPTPKFRLTFYVCCVGFASPLLFDERKFPYNLMLQSFVQCGGQDAFFETFRWALTQGGKVPIEEGLEHPNLPEGADEFLDSWLMLLEKMVNPKMVLENINSLTNDQTASSSKQGQPPFDPIKYLQQIHKKTFDCIMHLWNRKPLKVYGEHISETTLVILCHLLRGETIIQNKLAKDQNDAKSLESRNVGLGNLNLIANPAAADSSALARNQQFPAARSSSSGGLVRSGAIRAHHRDRASIEENEYNRTQIQQLVDMGFNREAAIEAFLHTSTLEQATDYLLTHQNQDWEMSEDDQMLRAIEMSLNEAGASTTNPTDQQQQGQSGDNNQQSTATSVETISTQPQEVSNQGVTLNESTTSVPILSNDQQLVEIKDPSTSSTKEQSNNSSSQQPQTSAQENYEPLSKELMDSLTNSLLSGCLRLLDTLPQTVHRVCDILLAVSQRNGEQWVKKMLQQLIDEIFNCVNKLLECSKPLTSSDRKSLTEWAAQMSQIPEAAKAASRIHLFSLLFEEKKNECAQYIEESNLISCLIQLLEAAQDILLCLKPKYTSSSTTNNKILTPKWLAPVILLIDLYDKAAISSKRKAPLLAMQKRQWKYFDDRNGKWTPYTQSNNKTIDDAYVNGENLVRFFVGRRKYCVQFPIMLQMNEETVTYRPIMFVNMTNTPTSSTGQDSSLTQKQQTDNDSPMDLAEDSTTSNIPLAILPPSATQKSIDKFKVVKELDSEQNLSLIRACVSFLSIPVDVEALQAVMRLILRITRDYEMARTFAELGGIKSVLKITQQSEFTEFISLATLIIRHVFEDPQTLKQTMEKVLRSLWATSGGNYKEMHYQLRTFHPAACRNSEMFSEIAKNIFRIQFNSIVTKKEDEDQRLLQSNAAQLLRLLPSKSLNPSLVPTDTVKEVISDLLNALTIKSTVTEDDLLHSIYTINQNLKTKLESMDTNESPQQQSSSTTEQAPEQMQTEQHQPSTATTTASTTNEQQVPIITKSSSKSHQSTVFEDTPSWRKEDLLFTQSVIMRILAELVRSYNVVAKLITDHQFTVGQSEYVTEDCSALAFILDNLLPNNQFIGDRDSPALARLLVVAIANSAHCQDAQVQLIGEVKAALLRALSLSESNEKHLRIQALTGIINTMIESYPLIQNGTTTAANQSLHNLRNLSSNLNSIIFRKGLFIDLARISHSLDLSSPHMAVTVNTVLKPLETLSRAIHHPSNQMVFNQKKNKTLTLSANGQQQSTNNANSIEMSNQPQIANESSTNNNQNQNSRDNHTIEESVPIEEEDTSMAVGSVVAESSSSNNQPSAVQQQDSNSCSTPIIQNPYVSDNINLLNSLLMDVNDHDSQTNDERSILGNRLHNRSNNLPVNDSVETVSVAEPMMDDQIVADEYDPSSQPAQDVEHVININAIETETEDSEEIDEDEEDEEDGEDEDVNENEDNSAAEDEEDDEEHADEEDGESDGDEEISFATQGQDLEDFVLRYAVPDELIWELEDNNSPRIVNADPVLAPYRYNDIVHLFEGEQHTNGADASQPTVPPGPSTVSAVHPLLSRNNVGDNVYSVNSASQNHQYNSSILPRNFRSSRQRLHRSNQSVASFNLPPNAHPTLNHTAQNWQPLLNNSLHPGGVHHANQPVLLQRLLGPSSTQNLLQITRAAIQPRLVFSSNDYQLFTTGSWNDNSQIGPESNDGSMLSSIATATTRWTEESKVLDSDSIHDCVANLKPDIIAVWEKYRDEEMNERKEKRKEMIEKDRKNQEQARQLAEKEKEKQQQTTTSTTNTTTETNQLSACNLTTVSSSNSEQAQLITENSGNLEVEQSHETTTSDQAQTENVAESEQMEIVTTQQQLSSNSGTGEIIQSAEQSTATSNQNDDLMTCSETISTEHEMEVTNINPTETTPEPNNTIEIPNAIDNSSSSSEPQASSASASSATVQATDQQQPSNSGNSEEIPEGIDPSFLAALPESIRQEVIAEQLRLQRIQQQRTATSSTNTTATNQQTSSTSNNEISPEFLAALPPVIQEEIIAQHNNEQQRNVSNPDSPVDPTDFIQTLPLPLRRQVLTDLDDSLLALLPSHLVTEAQMLRDELEARHRHIQERLLSTQATHALSRILRNASVRGLSSNNQRYTIQAVPHLGSIPFPFSSSGRNAALSNLGDASNVYVNVSGMSNVRGNHPGCLMNSKLRCKQLLDNEALTCLLIILFVDEPKLNIGRLHRVLRNLCNHIPTRQWIIQSLLSIMEKAREGKHNTTTNLDSSSSVKSKKNSTNSNNQTSWLSISMDAALGCKTDVFQVQRSNNSKQIQISINPQAAHIVCRHVLDTLIALAKSFPYQFLPDTFKDLNELKSTTSGNGNQSSGSLTPQQQQSNKDEFWDILIKLDSSRTNASSSGKGSKSQLKHNTSLSSSSLNQSTASSSVSDDNQLTGGQSSTLAQIISLLAHPIIKRSSLLTDKLLRLLSLLAKSLPPNSTEATSTSNTTPAASLIEQQQTISNKQASSKSSKETTSTEQNKSTSGVGEEQLRLAVEVLTSKSCSEEGLEDATSLLLKLSQNDPVIRVIVLKLLLQGARQLGQTVCQHINNLSDELKKLNQINQQPSTSSSGGEQDDDKFNKNKRVKGVIQDRFTKNPILITGTASTKHNPSIREVQLPSMTALTCKTSSQSFFLRILKVIIQLRESIKVASKTPTMRPTTTSRSIEVASSVNEQMEIDSKDVQQSSNLNQESLEAENTKETLSNQLQLNDLWESLSDSLLELANAPDQHAVLVLQPAVEAFFFVHACEKDQSKRQTEQNNPLLDSRDNLTSAERDAVDNDSTVASRNVDPSSLNDSMLASGNLGSQSTGNNALSKDTQKFLQFAETHKVVLNQILRQSTTPLSEGPFSVLVDHTRVLDFDVKRRYFRTELDLLDEGGRREDLAVHVRREHVFEDSFRELYRRSNEEWKNRFYIVFENEEGQDAGGLLREWYTIISREIFNPMYALFCTSPGDRVTYMINSSSHCNSNHLQYFKFVGRVIAKAIYDNKLLDCYFTRSFYKHILGKSVKYTDMESEDYTFYQSLVHFLEHDVSELGLDLTFSIEVQEFGVTEVRDLKENGRNIPVTEENKSEYVRLVCQEKMTYSIKKQLSAFLEGFYEIIPKRLISIFNEQELELLISGLPNIDIDDLKANTEYHKYQANSLQIQWFWRALRSFDQADRAKFLQFVTGTSKVPLQGFGSLEGMNGTQKFQIHKEDRSTDRLPSAHTCFNQLDLPVYETYDKLRLMLLKAIHECSEFGFA